MRCPSDSSRLIDSYSENVPAAYEWQKHVLAVWEALENNGIDLLGVAGPSEINDVDWGSRPAMTR